MPMHAPEKTKHAQTGKAEEKKNPRKHLLSGVLNGRRYRDRTCDNLIKSQVLYQLS